MKHSTFTISEIHMQTIRMSEVQLRSLSFVTLNQKNIEKVHFLISSVSFVIVKISHSCIYITVSIYGLYKVNGLMNTCKKCFKIIYLNRDSNHLIGHF